MAQDFLKLRHFKIMLLMQKLLEDNMLESVYSFQEFLYTLRKMMYFLLNLKENNFQFVLVLLWQLIKLRVKPFQMLASTFQNLCSLMVNYMLLCLEGYQGKRQEYFPSQTRILTHQAKVPKKISVLCFIYMIPLCIHA